MFILDIQELAINFRSAADTAFQCGAFGQEYPFNNFPYECCDDMCDLFGQILFEKKVRVCKVHGIYRYDNWEHKYSHVWIKLEDDMVIDLTGDQYKNDSIMLNWSIPYYVGKPNQLHKLFPKEEQRVLDYYGIDNYSNDNAKKRLWKLYNIILNFL